MIINCHREVSLGLILSDDILIKVGLDFLGLGNIQLLTRTRLFLCVRTIAIGCSHLIGLYSAILTDGTVNTRYQEFHLTLCTSTEITSVCHF